MIRAPVKCLARIILPGLAALFITSAATAQDQALLHPALTSKYWVTAGVFYPQRDFSASLSGQADEAPELDFGARFDLDDRDPLFSGEIGWQFGEKWSIAAQYFSASHSNSVVVDETIEWEDVVFDVGANIGAGTSTAVTRIYAARKFFNEGPHDLRLGAGVHWLDMSAYVEGEARIDDTTTEFRRRRGSVSAPLPNLGAWYRYSPSKNWAVGFRGDWLAADLGDIGGRIVNLVGSIDYAFNRNFGFGLTYQYFRLDADVSDDGWDGHADVIFQGPSLVLSGYWH